MSGYIGNIPTPQATQTRQSFTATASQTSFATAGYTPGFVDVFLNGVHLLDGTDYTASNGSDVVLTSGAAAGDMLEVVAYSTFQLANQSFTGDFSVDSPTFVVDSTNNRVGIGTSGPLYPLHLVGESQFEADGGGTSSVYRFTNSGTTSNDNSIVRVAIAGTTASSYIQFGNSTDSNAGQIEYNHNTNSTIFNTNAAEAMRITGAQRIFMGTTSPIAATTPSLTLHGDSVRVTFELYRPSTSGGNDLQAWRSDIGGTGTKVADVEANGDFNSATGNYATLSDERLKQDITPANSQWDDIKALEFKNYRMINLVETMGDDAPVYFGVIAQQLEAAGMNGLVEDKVDDDTQEVTKIVKTSILQMKAVKALQEAMERIEALEAEVAALKGGAA